MTTPIENNTIVWSKWWGSVLGVRKAGYCLVILWLVGAGTGGLSPLALPFLGAALFVYLGFAASLGLWFSLRCRTTLRATIWTLATLVGVSFGHYLLTSCCGPLALMGPQPPMRAYGYDPRPAWYRVLADVEVYSLTPPMTLAALAFSNDDIEHAEIHTYDDDDFLVRASLLRAFALSVLGVLVYGSAAVILLRLTLGRFTVATGRLPLPGGRPGRGKRVDAMGRRK